MRQILQRLDTGETTLLDVPAPGVAGPKLVVATRASLISSGTERMLVEFGRGNLLDKARRQPEKVRDVLTKVRTDGLISTFNAVQSKLGTPVAIGYCNAGVVLETGPGITRFKVGDRVVSNGPHAEIVAIPQTLAAKIPESVSFEHAAFAPIAAIGLQGIRLARPELGETVVVYGLGLIGLLCVQLLRANGCTVIGIDRNGARLALAEEFGALVVDGSNGVDVPARIHQWTDGLGADAVLLTLASDSDHPMREAARMSRKRGRIVLVGVTGLSLSRDEFYKKELSFQVSCSYGPGRYDPDYEERGIDYPAAYVRWTEQRNFEAVLAAMAAGRLDPAPLITHRFDIADAPRAYDLVASDQPSIGIVLRYPDSTSTQGMLAERRIELRTAAKAREPGRIAAGVIGAGNFATRVLLPILQRSGARLRTIASAAGASAAIAGKQFEFERVTSDLDDVFHDDQIDTVFILTRHDSHASLALRALECGKNVFVEKPLALTESELDAIEGSSRGLVMVGFNRRFAPFAVEARRHVSTRTGPLALNIIVNAGAIPREHWTQDAQVGGGRIVGEACHFIDLARFLVGDRITSLDVIPAVSRNGAPIDDITSMSLGFADGSVAAIQYFANGSKAYPKERIDCFYDGRSLSIDNWRRLRRYGIKGPLLNLAPTRQDKGHRAEIAEWTRAVCLGKNPPIPLSELVEVSRWAIRAGTLARRAPET